jgi:hypothetical protein
MSPVGMIVVMLDPAKAGIVQPPLTPVFAHPILTV